MLHVVIDRESETALFVRVERTATAIRSAASSGIRAGTIHLTSVVKKDVLSGQVLHRRSGTLSRAIHNRMDDPLVGVVAVGREAPHARPLNDGSRPHVIEAKPGKVLAFVPAGTAFAIRNSAFVGKGVAGGSWYGIKRASLKRTLAENTIFRSRVNHPGNPPYRFMELGLTMATPRIREILEQKIAAAVNSGNVPIITMNEVTGRSE